MLDGGDDDWMPGQSQDMHQQVLNTRAYQYWWVSLFAKLMSAFSYKYRYICK
jgi:hypothetical protein